MEQSSGEVDPSEGQEVPHFLGNSNDHYPLQKKLATGFYHESAESPPHSHSLPPSVRDDFEYIFLTSSTYAESRLFLTYLTRFFQLHL
jgi:hypothetical protein